MWSVECGVEARGWSFRFNEGKPLRLHFDPIDEQGEGITTSGDGENDDPHQGMPEVCRRSRKDA